MNDLGPRRSFFDKDAWRYTAAVKGDFNFQDNQFISHFGYDTGFVYSQLNEVETDSGDAQDSLLVAQVTAGNFSTFIGLSAPVPGVAPIFVNGVTTGRTPPYDNRPAPFPASYARPKPSHITNYPVDA